MIRLLRLEALEARIALSADAAHLLQDVSAGSSDSLPRDFTSSNGSVYFLADASQQASQLWQTDGDQTALVHSQSSTGTIQFQGLFDYQDELVFLKSEFADGASGYGLELWTSQGTQESTAALKNFGIKAGQVADSPDVSQGPYFASSGDQLFASIDGRNSRGRELWTSDLTSVGTVLLTDIDPGAPSSVPNSWIAFEGKVYFSASSASSGEELWVSDGVTTELVQDFMPGTQGSYPSGMLVAEGSLFFATHDVGSDGVYSSDDHMKWWRLDDPVAGPILIHDFGAGSGASLIKTQLAYFQGDLYGVAQDPVHGVELWRTDDSPEGVSLLMDLNPYGDSLPWQPTATYDALFFAATDGEHGEELWKTDGTELGTVMVADLNASGNSSPSDLVAKDGELFFSAFDGTERSLWQSDGTPEGTLQVANRDDGVNGIDPEGLTILHSTLYYSASTAETGREPWAARIYSWHAAYMPVDVNRSGDVTALDALNVINEMGDHQYSDPSDGHLPDDRPDGAFHFDVSGDGYVTALDAIRVINALDDSDGGTGSEGEQVTAEQVAAEQVALPWSPSLSVLATDSGTSPSSVVDDAASTIDETLTGRLIPSSENDVDVLPVGSTSATSNASREDDSIDTPLARLQESAAGTLQGSAIDEALLLEDWLGSDPGL